MAARYSLEQAHSRATARITANSAPTARGCIEWVGKLDRDGYGRAFIVWAGKRECLAHRIAYLLESGAIPAGCEIDHVCGNRRCVNPDHLRAVPHAVNVKSADYVTNHRNRVKRECLRGHPLNGGNLILERTPRGYARKCRQCRNTRRAKRHNQQET